jgi:sn-glycerol 3-phosphate transport system substrate-binding protein
MKFDTSRRAFLRTMLMGSGAAILAACGQTATEQPAAPTAAPEQSAPTSPPAAEATATAPATSSGNRTNIVYWGSFSADLGRAEQSMVQQFNESQDEVRVEYQFQGDYAENAQRFTAGLRANQIPDVMLLSDVWWFGFYLAGALTPLDELLAEANVDLDDFEPVLLNETVRQGQHFVIPWARSTPIFYYNKDQWAEAGLPDRAPANWAEMSEWGESLVQRSGNRIDRPAFVHPNGASFIAWLFQGVTWQHNGKYSTADFEMTMTDPNTIRAGEFYNATVNTERWAALAPDTNREFISGNASSMMGSTASLAGIERSSQFPVGVGFLPEADVFGCPTGGAGLVIPEPIALEKKRAAMKYIAWLSETDQVVTWSQATGYVPQTRSALDAEKMQAFYVDNPNFRTAVEQLPKTQAQDTARVFVRNGDTIIGRGLERIMLNREATEKVFSDVNAELTRAAAPIIADLQRVEG